MSILIATGAHANGSSSTQINVPKACTFTSAIDSEHTASVNIGTYTENIGSTTFNIACNDSEGFAVYAVGITGDTFGNNKLAATIGGASVPSSDIITGTATSGSVSNWAMKLEPVAGANAPTINGGFNNYAEVPTTFTKVASFSSGTGETISSSFKSTYSAFISSLQPAGSYEGKVKYTMVYPGNSEPPTGPVTAEAGKVYYNPGVSSVTDTMGHQTINDTDTEVTLWASNFKRSGYGFVGWSDKWDWELNQNDSNGNGTENNAGYHIYGPNQTITITAGQYSGDNDGLSLYAVWAPSTGILQTWNNCSFMSVGQVTALTDNRDNDTYAVAKLADGNCWMIENLRLDNTAELTAENTNKPSLPLTNDNGTTSNYLSVSSNSWCSSNTSGCINQSKLNTENTTNAISNMSESNGGADANIYSYGNYYNWYSATAGTGTSNVSSGNATGSICPKGWHLPTGAIGGEFSALDLAMGGTGSDQSHSTASNRWRTFPVNGLYSALRDSNYSDGRGEYGYYWSSTASRSNNAYDLDFNNSDLSPGTYDGAGNNYGFSVRCVANTPTTSLEQAYAKAGKTKYNGYYKMQDMNSSICAAATVVDEDAALRVIDTRDNKTYWITKLQDGHCWMTQNLDLNLDSNTTYTHADTDLGWGSDTATTTWRPTRSTIDATNVTNNSIPNWSDDDNTPYSLDPGNWYWKNDPFYESTDNNFLNNQPGDKFQKDVAFASNGEHGHVGNYYNWSAAVAMNSTSSYTSSTYNNIANNPQNSICPAGWRLPTISNAGTGEGSTNEFRRLNVLYNSNSTSSSQNLEKAPPYFVRAGYVDSSAQYNAGYYGSYWSSTVFASSGTYFLDFSSPSVSPEYYSYRFLGLSVRCVAR